MPRALPECGGWVLERPIPQTPDRDATGCYPLFCCLDWSRLRDDLENAGRQWVSLALVADPFAEVAPPALERCFDVVRPFKERFVADLSKPAEQIASTHHRHYAMKALQKVEVTICPEPLHYLDEWTALYDNVIRKFSLTGIRAFSRRAFERQLAIPGLVMFRAAAARETVGLDLWYVQGDVVYGHLAAYNARGYDLRASYAVKWEVLRHFSGTARWLDLGGAAGAAADANDGLAQFKRGWSTGTLQTYFCGRVFDRDRYAALSSGLPETTYFPAYRRGEFG